MNAKLIALALLATACAPQMSDADADALIGQDAPPPAFPVLYTGSTIQGETLSVAVQLPVARSGKQVLFFASFQSTGTDIGPCHPRLAASDPCLDIGPTDQYIFAQARTNNNGLATATFDLPIDAYSQVFFQAVVINNGKGFTSQVTTVDVDPYVAPQGDNCADPIAAPNGGTFTGTTTNMLDDYDLGGGNACTGWGTSGPDAVYEVMVAAGATLTASLDDAPGATLTDWSVWMYPAAECANDPVAACASGDDSGNPEVAQWENTLGVDTMIHVVVDGYVAAGDYVLDLSTSECGDGVAEGPEECDGNDFATICSDGVTLPAACNADCTSDLTACPVPAGETCGNPIMVPAGGATYADTTVGWTDDYDLALSGASCTSWASAGPDQVYMVTLADGETVTATLQPPVGSGAFTDFSIWISSDCGDLINNCVAGDDTGNPETTSYTNTTGAAQDLYIVADGWSSSSAGDFELEIVVGP